MQLREMMRTQVVTIEPTETAGAAWSTMRRRRIRHLVVTENDAIVGVLSARDLNGPGDPDRLVRDLMTPDAVSAEPDTTLDEAAELMLRDRIGSLPVVEDGRLVGIVTATDVLDELSREARPRRRKRGSRRRAPFAAELPKALKPVTGRTKAPLIPAHIRVMGVHLNEQDKAQIRQKLGKKLGKFGTAIERVSVRVKDVNGPRGGVDQLCRVKVVLSGLPSIVFEHQDSVLEPAIDGALAGAERAVRKALERERTKPLKSGRAGSSVEMR